MEVMSDYEGELTVVIGKTGKDIKGEDAYDYILGYTSGNDVSARNAQFASSQWCFSKGMLPRNIWLLESVFEKVVMEDL